VKVVVIVDDVDVVVGVCSKQMIAFLKITELTLGGIDMLN
jgi:hypothetical protein